MNHYVHEPLALELIEVVGVVHDRLTPSESYQDDKNGSHRIKMCDGIKSKSSLQSRNIISKSICNKSMHELMHGE